MNRRLNILLCLFALSFAWISLFCIQAPGSTLNSAMHHHIPAPVNELCVNMHGWFLEVSQNLSVADAVKILFALVVFALLVLKNNLVSKINLCFYKLNHFLKSKFYSRRKFLSWLALFELRDFGV